MRLIFYEGFCGVHIIIIIILLIIIVVFQIMNFHYNDFIACFTPLSFYRIRLFRVLLYLDIMAFKLSIFPLFSAEWRYFGDVMND